MPRLKTATKRYRQAKAWRITQVGIPCYTGGRTEDDMMQRILADIAKSKANPMLNTYFRNANDAASWCAKNASGCCMVLVASRDRRRRPDAWEWKREDPYPLPQLFSRYDVTVQRKR